MLQGIRSQFNMNSNRSPVIEWVSKATHDALPQEVFNQKIPGILHRGFTW